MSNPFDLNRGKYYVDSAKIKSEPTTKYLQDI